MDGLAELEIVRLDRIEKRARKSPAEEMVDAGQSAKRNAEMRSWHGVPTSLILRQKLEDLWQRQNGINPSRQRPEKRSRLRK